MIALWPTISYTNQPILYLGAVVLAHSLRDNGSRAKLVALYTPDTLQASTINELQVRSPHPSTHETGLPRNNS